MHLVHVYAGVLSGLIILLSAIPYVLSIVRRKTVPNRVTWFIWSTVGAVALATYWASGARETMWAAVIGLTNPCLIFVLSLKYGTKAWTRLDVSCLLGAAVTLCAWYVSGSPLIGLAMSLLIDVFGAIPTARKAWKEPWTEDKTAWIMFTIGSAVNFVAVGKWSVAIALYPIYGTAVGVLICVPLVLYRTKQKGDLNGSLLERDRSWRSS